MKGFSNGNLHGMKNEIGSRLFLMNSLANGTASSDNGSSSSVLQLSYIVVIIIVCSCFVGLLFVYCMCFHQSINKKKIHMLVRETNIEGTDV
jgi:hypothetical protein